MNWCACPDPDQKQLIANVTVSRQNPLWASARGKISPRPSSQITALLLYQSASVPPLHALACISSCKHPQDKRPETERKCLLDKDGLDFIINLTRGLSSPGSLFYFNFHLFPINMPPRRKNIFPPQAFQGIPNAPGEQIPVKSCFLWGKMSWIYASDTRSRR